MKPFRLIPAYKDYIWGGNKLKQMYNKKTDLDIVAESWELSAHKDGSSIISCDADENIVGMMFLDFVKQFPEFLGESVRKLDYFPILIKLIDAKNDLSVQVHPNDSYAKEHENSLGKTEMWYVLDCDEGSYLYMGFARDVELSEMRERIENNTLTEVLNKIYVKKGDVFFIEAGTIHAINKGIVIAEIQQNSNITYRVYDYGRKEINGNRRELHIEKALDVTNRAKYMPTTEHLRIIAIGADFPEKQLAKCSYFTVISVLLKDTYTLRENAYSFTSILVAEGEMKITERETTISAQKGDCIFVPAGDRLITITGNSRFLLTTY